MMTNKHILSLIIVSCVSAAQASTQFSCPQHIVTGSNGKLTTPAKVNNVTLLASTLTPGKNKNYRLVDTWLTSFDGQTKTYTNLMCDYKNANEPLALGLHLSAQGHFKHLYNDKHFTDDVGQSFCGASKTCRILT